MVTVASRPDATTLGHVALYARDTRWRRAIAKSLEEAGHSAGQAATPEEVHRLLSAQRFDVLSLRVQDEQEAHEIAEVLEDIKLPIHTILIGNASALPLTLKRRRGGTFRYVPGPLPAKELTRLVDVSISSGTWEDGAAENGTSPRFEEVDVEELIQNAASAVHSRARRKRQRFHTAIRGPAMCAYADPAKLRRALTDLLALVVSLAPYGSLVSAEADSSADDWVIRIGAESRRRTARWPSQVTEAVREETKKLTSIARAVKEQGGMLWVDLPRGAAPAFCMTLPVPTEAAQSVPA